MSYSVLKFGGSAATDPVRIAEIFCADPERNRVATISAIGRPPDTPDCDKITDVLLRLEDATARNDTTIMRQAQEEVIERHRSTYAMLGERVLKSTLDQGYRYLQPSHLTSGYAWVGEFLGTSLLAKLTGARFVSTGLRFDCDSRLDVGASLPRTRQKIVEGIGLAGQQVVAEGFYGTHRATGLPVTLPRGGGDTSAVIIAKAIGAQCENYTDVDGVYTSDPSEDPQATVHERLSYQEMREIVDAAPERNGVLHGMAVDLAEKHRVAIQVRNAFNLAAPGTHISQVPSAVERRLTVA